MPKARLTCTACSLRRMKCDRKQPCTRCVKRDEASSCSREWDGPYDPLKHRMYPKSKVPQNVGRDWPRRQRVAATQEAHSPQPTFNDDTNVTASQPFAKDVRQEAPNGFQAANEPTSLGLTKNERERSSSSELSNLPSVMEEHASAENTANATGHHHAGSSPRDIEKQRLQTLIPTSLQMSRLVEYHEQCLLWYHGCVHGPTFRTELNTALQGSDGLQLKRLDLRWSALLFSIMAASLTCTSDSVAHSWGFTKVQKRYLSKQWYEASVACLHLGDYTSKLNVYSIQAIQVLSISAHIIGFSNKQFVIFGVALRIAQNLGLQRLAQDPDLDEFPADSAGMLSSRKDVLIRREVGRRIWAQMCTQDWFSIPSSDMYYINKRHFTTSRPRRIDDENMVPAGDQVPVATDSGNLMYDFASLMADFHDSITALSDPAAKYDQVLKYDSRMRALRETPYLASTEKSDISEPQWVRWAKGVASIVQAHKIIMIHRSFLGKSFTDPRYAYTRWASIAASKTILRNAEIAIADVERPVFWPDQAHMVGASITLCLDIYHRSKAEPEFAEHKNLIDHAITLLGRYDDSTLAVRGIRLLSSLLDGIAQQQPFRHHARHGKENEAYPHEGNPLAWPLEDRQSIDAIWASRQSSSADDSCQSTVSSRTSTAGDAGALEVPTQNADCFNGINGDASFGSVNDNGVLSDTSWWTDFFSDYFPAQSGFEDPFLFEELVAQAP